MSSAAPASAAPAAALAAAALTPAAPLAPLQGGVVRSVLSGDTIVVRPKGVSTPGSEKTVHIAGIAAPRMGTRDRDDEPQAFASREFLRLLMVGRECRYRLEYTVPVANGGEARCFAHVFLPPKAPGQPDTNVSHEVLAAGWARVHDSNSRRNTAAVPEEEEEGGWKAVQRQVQETAVEAAKGIWGPDDLLKVEHTMPVDSAAFLAEHKGKEIESVVEAVRDGTMLRVRLFLSPRHHQLINLHLAGVKSPRLAGAGGAGASDSSEPFAEESRFFVESRLLQRNVKVLLLNMPNSGAGPTPFAATASAAAEQAPYTAAFFIGTAIHPVGDISQFLLSAGLATVDLRDWNAGMLSAIGGMEKYRSAERTAKEKRLNIWKDWKPPANGANLPAAPTARHFEATVARIISGDTIHVRRTDSQIEERIQLSDVRQPSPKDAKQAGYAYEAREFLRRRLVGKTVSVTLDYIKKAEAGFDERRYATVRPTSGNKDFKGVNIGEQLIARGLATVLRHRRDDEDRSPDFELLVTAEAKAVAELKGLHSGKDLEPPRFVEASESAGKANSYLPALKRGGKSAAIVDFVASASRLKLIVPRENARLNLVLAGIRAPRTARNASEKDEPFGREAFDFTSRRALMRDVDAEFFSVDKTGGFIGAVYLNNRTDNLAVDLVREGLASVHAYSAEGLSFGAQLFAAEDEAKAARKGMWATYDAAAEAAASASVGSGTAWGKNGAAAAAPAAPTAARREYLDVIISDVARGSLNTPFTFSMQILDDRIHELEGLMTELSMHGRGAAPATPPKAGDWVCAKFSGDGAWYRAQVLRNHPAQKKAELRFVDYGNVEPVAYTDMRSLDAARFGKARLPAQAHEARLSFVHPFRASASGAGEEYAQESLDRFREVAEGRKLIANVDLRQAGPGGLMHVTLYDPEDAGALAAGRPEACINADLAREGYVVLDRSVPYWKAYPGMTKALEEATTEAQRRHRGIYELGDPTEA